MNVIRGEDACTVYGGSDFLGSFINALPKARDVAREIGKDLYKATHTKQEHVNQCGKDSF